MSLRGLGKDDLVCRRERVLLEGARYWEADGPNSVRVKESALLLQRKVLARVVRNVLVIMAKLAAEKGL